MSSSTAFVMSVMLFKPTIPHSSNQLTKLCKVVGHNSPISLQRCHISGIRPANPPATLTRFLSVEKVTGEDSREMLLSSGSKSATAAGCCFDTLLTPSSSETLK